jgi:hypothetical protein
MKGIAAQLMAVNPTAIAIAFLSIVLNPLSFRSFYTVYFPFYPKSDD